MLSIAFLLLISRYQSGCHKNKSYSGHLLVICLNAVKIAKDCLNCVRNGLEQGKAVYVYLNIYSNANPPVTPPKRGPTQNTQCWLNVSFWGLSSLNTNAAPKALAGLRQPR